MEQWQPIIIAALMALPPLIAQYWTARRDKERNLLDQSKAKAEAERNAAAEWSKLYTACREENDILRKEIEELEGQIKLLSTKLVEAERKVEEMQRRRRPRNLAQGG